MNFVQKVRALREIRRKLFDRLRNLISSTVLESDAAKGMNGLNPKRLAFVFTALIPAVAISACPVAPANIPSTAAKSLAINKLSTLLKCTADDPLNDQSPCNTFAARGLEAIYSVSDFKSGDRFMSANQIADFVSTNKNWSRIGIVLDADNNLCAQALANNAYPVIAIKKAVGHGHIALVIPGEPTTSASWGMLAANSASFFINKPASAYLSGPLSKAYQSVDARTAEFYYRKPQGLKIDAKTGQK